MSIILGSVIYELTHRFWRSYGGLTDGLALVGAEPPLFEGVAFARNPSEYLNIFTAGDVTNEYCVAQLEPPPLVIFS
jgi:hypothetical protein